MTGDNKWIRSLKDNAAGKVVTDGAGSRWEWDAQQDETSRQLRKLQNDELAIEQTNLQPKGVARGARQAPAVTRTLEAAEKGETGCRRRVRPLRQRRKPPRR